MPVRGIKETQQVAEKGKNLLELNVKLTSIVLLVVVIGFCYQSFVSYERLWKLILERRTEWL